MLAIFLPGYKAMPGNIDKLPIAIVNDDNGDYGNQISKQLNNSLPFDHIKKIFLIRKQIISWSIMN